MSKTSVIQHPAKAPLLIIRAEYLVMCDGNACAAALLNEFEQWENHMQSVNDRDESEWAKPGEEAPSIEEWFYWTLEDVARELFYVYGKQVVANALDTLVEKKFIDRRMKGVNEMDHRYQYRMNVTIVQDAVNGFDVKAFDNSILKHRSSKLKHRKLNNETLKDSSRVGDKDKHIAPPQNGGEASPPKTRKIPSRTEEFRVVASESFGITDMDALDKNAAVRINLLVKWLKENASGATAEKLREFYRWYDGVTDRASRPRAVTTFALRYREWEQSGQKPLLPAFDPNPFAGLRFGP